MNSHRDTGTQRDLNETTGQIIDAAMLIHTKLGPGLLESILTYELELRGLAVQRQVPVPIIYGDLHFEEGFRADLIVDASVVVELKSVETLAPVHGKQLFNLSQAAGLSPGLADQLRRTAAQGWNQADREQTLTNP